jgi:RHS repeat-associated protein
MNGHSTQLQAYVLLPGGEVLSPGPDTFWHTDWLGSVRLATSAGGRTATFDRAFAPFGEMYNTVTGGTANPDFTGDTQDTVSGTYDTENRELNPNQGRWISPDPINFGAHLGDPQSWNAYSYVADNPLSATDPSGLDCVFLNDAGTGIDEVDEEKGKECTDLGGIYVPGKLTGYGVDPEDNTITSLTYDPSSPNNFGSDSGGDIHPGLAALQQVGAMAPAIYKSMAIFEGGSLLGGAALYAGGAFAAPAIEQVGVTGDLNFLLDRLAMMKPNVTNPELEGIVNKLFQVTDKLPGGTAGAVRYESMTGDLLSPAGHAQKAADTVRELYSFLQDNPGISNSDKAVARELIRDLTNAVSGR